MNTWLVHFYIFLAVYAVGVVAVFSKLYSVAVKYKVSKSLTKWRRVVVLDALSWPYYVVRHGVEGFYKEIK